MSYTGLKMTLWQEGIQVILTVHDDGRGISAEALQPGKSPGQGTTVTIRVPVC